MTDDELDELIGPVCTLADLKTNAEHTNRKRKPHPVDLDILIVAARKVKAGFGFHVETMKL
jgi:hypothetical protein